MPIRTTLLASLLAVVFVVTSSPSQALSDDGRDARRDVVSRGLYTDSPPRRPEPARRVGDIVKYSASYGAHLVVTTQFRSLAALGDQEFSWFLRTSNHEFDWYSSLVVPAGKDKGRFTLIDPDAYQPRCGKAVLDRPGRTVTLRIPASCLGSPTWVKVANGVRVYTDTREYSDDARREGVRASAWKYGPQLTP